MSARSLLVRSGRRSAVWLPVVLLVAACAASPKTAGGPSPSPSPSYATPTTSSAPTCSPEAVVAGWSLQRRAAAIVTIPVRNFDLAGARPEIRAGAMGVLFLGSASPPGDLAVRVAALVRQAPGPGRPLVMADEEGGGVQRLAGAVSSLPWPRDMARTMTPQAVRTAAARLGRQLRALGVTVDLAPVADVDDRPGPSASNPDGARSFSGTPQVAARYAMVFAQGLRDGGVLPVLKHFPGLGGSQGNTDVGPGSTVPLSTLQTTGLVPFRSGVAAGLPAVMVSNARVPGLTGAPASLSPAVVQDLLRRRLRFHGLVVTDSLSAEAVLGTGLTLPAAVVRSLVAGDDLVLFGSTLNSQQVALLRPDNVRRSFDAIVQAVVDAVRAGTLSVRRLDAAVLAVLGAAGARLCP